MLEIWGRRNASNVMPVMWAVGEMNLPHRRHDLGGSFGGVDTPEYLALNPNGRIPTLRDDGFVLWESNAIVRYLSRRYGRGTLWPEAERLQLSGGRIPDGRRAAQFRQQPLTVACADAGGVVQDQPVSQPPGALRLGWRHHGG